MTFEGTYSEEGNYIWLGYSQAHSKPCCKKMHHYTLDSTHEILTRWVDFQLNKKCLWCGTPFIFNITEKPLKEKV